MGWRSGGVGGGVWVHANVRLCDYQLIPHVEERSGGGVRVGCERSGGWRRLV